MKYFISRPISPLPDMYWEERKDCNGWCQANVYSFGTIVYSSPLFPTPAMVLHILKKAGYEFLAEDMPEGWLAPPQQALSTKEVAQAFGLKGNQVSAACKNGSLRSLYNAAGEYSIREEDAADWYLARTQKKSKPKKVSGQKCPLCDAKMVKDGVGKAPPICSKCGWPRRVRPMI